MQREEEEERMARKPRVEGDKAAIENAIKSQLI